MDAHGVARLEGRQIAFGGERGDLRLLDLLDEFMASSFINAHRPGASRGAHPRSCSEVGAHIHIRFGAVDGGAAENSAGQAGSELSSLTANG